MKNTILNNFGLKLLALLLAIVTWVYIVIELHQGSGRETAALQSMLPSYRLESKKIPIKLNIMGEPKEGYQVAYDRVVLNPSEFILVGPKALIAHLSAIETETVDITGSNKTFMKDISVIPPTKGVIKEKFVTITVPILKKRD